MKTTLVVTIWSLLLTALVGGSQNNLDDAQTHFVEVLGDQFYLNGQRYHFLGTNYWYGMNLGAPVSGNIGRLRRELDELAELGVTNLRIMGSTQGPDNKPRRIVPSLEYEKGKYNIDLWEGLDTFLDEMKKRGMKAVITLNNFWEWSGGFGAYDEWINGRFNSYPTSFYGDKNLTDHMLKFIDDIINRVNSVSGVIYKDDPTIMAWQLANEPRAGNWDTWVKWIKETSEFIKHRAPKHLVSIGNEGTITSCSEQGNKVETIDYITIHAWAQNWGWYTPRTEDGLDRGISSAKNYIKSNVDHNKALNKPVVLEEFGLARDGASYDPSADVSIRDKYFRAIFEYCLELAGEDSGIRGVNFWAWAGEGRPKNKGGDWWRKGDPFTGDPPHERQGWYSVYDKDNTTKALLKEFSEKFENLTNSN